MDQGEGLEDSGEKEDPLDFALWKAEKPGEDAAWDAPWGRGRPGWHIECSAMAEAELGVGFAIHGGGSDLLFPHHENEAAQTRAARGEELARIWMHSGMLQLPSGTMGKSLGNAIGLADAIDAWGSETLLMLFAGGHPRQPIAYSEDTLSDARARVERVREAGRALVNGPSPGDMAPLRDRFLDALADDFNTAAALAALFDWIREANRRPEPVGRSHLTEMLGLLGLEGLLEPEPEAGEEERRLAEERREARARRDFAEADRLRDELLARGWTVRDTAAGFALVRAG